MCYDQGSTQGKIAEVVWVARAWQAWRSDFSDLRVDEVEGFVWEVTNDRGDSCDPPKGLGLYICRSLPPRQILSLAVNTIITDYPNVVLTPVTITAFLFDSGHAYALTQAHSSLLGKSV